MAQGVAYPRSHGESIRRNFTEQAKLQVVELQSRATGAENDFLPYLRIHCAPR
jgi:hypothetical protein